MRCGRAPSSVEVLELMYCSRTRTYMATEKPAAGAVSTKVRLL